MNALRSLERFTLCLFASAAFLAAVYLFLTFRIVPVNEDAGTFIPIAREVLQGAVPTKDVMTWKTPGMYYLAALWMKFFGTAYERVVLLVYLVNVLNCLLLYPALSRFVSSRIPRLLLCLSYFYSALLFEGFWVVLEPFQVAFILAAYLVYSGGGEGLLKYGLTGLLLGCSIMTKQYSAFVLAGFLVAIWFDRRKEGGAAALKKMIVTALFATVPFFVFVGLTGADMMNALRSFGAFGGISESYAAAGWSGPGRLILGLLAGAVQANWIFLPFVIFLILLLRKSDYFSASGRAWVTVVILFVFSSLPLLVRQFNHYFLLVAPWSYLLLGMMLGPALDGGEKTGAKKGYVTAAAAVCILVVLPVFLSATPSFYYRPKVVIALFTLLFLAIVLGALYVGSRFSGYRFDTSAVVIALCATVFFETLFLGMKLPLRELRVLKQEQTSEAKEINRVFTRGSSVYVIGYRPYVYVTCDFVNPLHDYEFGNAQLPVNDWDRIGSVLIGEESVPSYRSILDAHGFRKVGELKGRAEFFEKSKP